MLGTVPSSEGYHYESAIVVIAPLLCGGPTPGLAGKGFAEKLLLGEIEFLQLGNDVRMRGVILGGECGPV